MKNIIMSMSADPFRIVLMPILRVDLRFLPEAPKRVFEEYAKERSAYFWSSNIPNSGCFRPPRPTLAGMEEVALLLPPCAWHGYRTVHAITAFLRRACLQLNVNLHRRQCSTWFSSYWMCWVFLIWPLPNDTSCTGRASFYRHWKAFKFRLPCTEGKLIRTEWY